MSQFRNLDLIEVRGIHLAVFSNPLIVSDTNYLFLINKKNNTYSAIYAPIVGYGLLCDVNPKPVVCCKP